MLLNSLFFIRFKYTFICISIYLLLYTFPIRLTNLYILNIPDHLKNQICDVTSLFYLGIVPYIFSLVFSYFFITFFSYYIFIDSSVRSFILGRVLFIVLIISSFISGFFVSYTLFVSILDKLFSNFEILKCSLLNAFFLTLGSILTYIACEYITQKGLFNGFLVILWIHLLFRISNIFNSIFLGMNNLEIILLISFLIFIFTIIFLLEKYFLNIFIFSSSITYQQLSSSKSFILNHTNLLSYSKYIFNFLGIVPVFMSYFIHDLYLYYSTSYFFDQHVIFTVIKLFILLLVIYIYIIFIHNYSSVINSFLSTNMYLLGIYPTKYTVYFISSLYRMNIIFLYFYYIFIFYISFLVLSSLFLLPDSLFTKWHMVTIYLFLRLFIYIIIQIGILL